MDSLSDLSKKPIPVPRTNKDNLKKPVPLPRHTIVNDNLRLDMNDSTRPSHVSATQSHDYVKNSVGLGLGLGLSKIGLLKDGLQEKGKAVIESTRNVSALVEKSMRGIIDKRRTGVQSLPSKEDAPEMSQSHKSLPCQDIGLGLFQSRPITFQFPLNGGSEWQQSHLLASEGTSADCSPPSAPPPMYPPPPLPDESVYDEVQSVISSHSSSTSNCDQYCRSSTPVSIADSEPYYEDLSMTRSQIPASPCTSNSKGGLAQKSRPNHVSQNVDSPSYTNDGTLLFNNIYQQDPTSDTSSHTNSCSSDSVSLLGELEKTPYLSGEESFENSPTSNSPGQLSFQSIQNDLYTNLDLFCMPPIILRDKPIENRVKVSSSVIKDFDPLYDNNRSLTASVDKRLPALLNENQSSTEAINPYGKINKIVHSDVSTLEESESDEGDTDETVCPVVPPRRYDSMIPLPTIPQESNGNLSKPTQPQMVGTDRNICAVNDSLNITRPTYTQERQAPRIERSTSEPRNHPLAESEPVSTKARKTRVDRWNSIKRTFKSVADGSRRSVTKPAEPVTTQIIDRPNLSSQLMVHCGELYKAAWGELRRDLTKRYCVLAEGKLSCFADKICSDVREVFPLDTILSIQLVLDHKVSTDGYNLHCLELSSRWKGRRTSNVFGSVGSTERKVWMQKILEGLTTVFPLRLSCDFERTGWCFMKEGISGIWTAAWILLTKRTLFYCLNCGVVQEIDLRKARCIELQECGQNSPKVAEKGQIILVDFPGQSIYLQMDFHQETVIWRNIIKAASVENGPNLSQQQLTRDEIPAIVDKCISFVYAHGSMSEGIYRRSGANSSVERLLKQFRQDAWSVQLSRQEYTEYDVASVLKRFFRDLPESLLTTELHGELCEIAAGKCGVDRMTPYRRTLEKLPPINFLTTRKLLGHLHFIHEQHEKNLMPVDNLASIWGPTLLHTEGSDSLNWSKVESSVIADLITFYPNLFDVDVAELTRERRIQEALERLHAGNSNVFPNKPSGDLKVWIHIGTRDSKNTVNVTLGPQKLADEVCTELSTKMSVPPHELCLEEVVFGGALIRPLHHTERVLDTVLRWGYWDEAARKDNCLVLRKNSTFSEIAPLAKPPLTHSGELRFADQKSKSFKSYLFEFTQAKLSYYKDKSGSHKLGEWKIEDIVWYIGHEPKRNPQMRWAITFVNKHHFKKRSKDNPFFGCTIAGTSKDEQLKWMAAMLIGEHPQGLLPSPALLQ